MERSSLSVLFWFLSLYHLSFLLYYKFCNSVNTWFLHSFWFSLVLFYHFALTFLRSLRELFLGLPENRFWSSSDLHAALDRPQSRNEGSGETNTQMDHGCSFSMGPSETPHEYVFAKIKGGRCLFIDFHSKLISVALWELAPHISDSYVHIFQVVRKRETHRSNSGRLRGKLVDVTGTSSETRRILGNAEEGALSRDWCIVFSIGLAQSALKHLLCESLICYSTLLWCLDVPLLPLCCLEWLLAFSSTVLAYHLENWSLTTKTCNLE